MADSIYTFDPTAANNTSLDTIPYGPNQLYHNQIDNLFRAINAKTAQWVDDQGGVATTAGTANAQTVTLASGFTAYAAGQIFRVKIGSGLTNTSATVTINVNSISAKTVKVNYGGVLAAPIPGDIQAGSYCTFLYDGTYLVLLDAQQQGRYPPGHLQGLTLSNNGSDATNDIDIAVGSARDSTDAANIDLASALTKRIDASWAVGTNQGGLDGTESVAGTPDTSTWYHVWLIKRPDTGVVDALFSESATSPTMPTNYTLKRRIGSVYNDSSGNIKAFTQVGDTFRWVAPAQDRSSTSAQASTLATISVPTGIVVAPIITVAQQQGTAGNVYTEIGSAGATLSANHLITQTIPANDLSVGNPPPNFFTNTSAQIQFAVTISSGTLAANTLTVMGWVDRRGRDA